MLTLNITNLTQSESVNRSRPSSSRPNSSSIPRALNALNDTSEEEDDESSPVVSQPKITNATSGSSPPAYSSAFDRGGTSSSGASGLGPPTAPLNLNKSSKKDGDVNANDGEYSSLLNLTMEHVIRLDIGMLKTVF